MIKKTKTTVLWFVTQNKIKPFFRLSNVWTQKAFSLYCSPISKSIKGEQNKGEKQTIKERKGRVNMK